MMSYPEDLYLSSRNFLGRRSSWLESEQKYSISDTTETRFGSSGLFRVLVRIADSPANSPALTLLCLWDIPEVMSDQLCSEGKEVFVGISRPHPPNEEQALHD